VGVEVGEQVDGRVVVHQRRAEASAALGDEAVELVDQCVEVAAVTRRGRLSGLDCRRFAALQAVDLELGEGAGDAQPSVRVEPFGAWVGMLGEQGQRTVDEPRTPGRMPGGVRGLCVDPEPFDPGNQVVTRCRRSSCRQEVTSG
ncbi:MAG TPA: hypothetical protein VI110_08135, partial [Lapillicoccus sp.]